MKTLNVKVMLGTMSNAGDGGRNDINIATAVLADATAKGFVSVVGVQWGVLDRVNGGHDVQGPSRLGHRAQVRQLPVESGLRRATRPAAYNSTMAPNDHAYGVESWGYLRNAITKGKVTSYNAWNMVLDRSGLGNDTSRDWRQNALLVADGGTVTATPTYYVFRHLSQYVVPGATVVGTTGGDAVAFKNPDGSLVVGDVQQRRREQQLRRRDRRQEVPVRHARQRLGDREVQAVADRLDAAVHKIAQPNRLGDFVFGAVCRLARRFVW